MNNSERKIFREFVIYNGKMICIKTPYLCKYSIIKISWCRNLAFKSLKIKHEACLEDWIRLEDFGFFQFFRHNFFSHLG